MELERRDTTLRGFARRERFNDSARVLRLIGLPTHVVYHYTRLARHTAKLPHELLDYAAQPPDTAQAYRDAGTSLAEGYASRPDVAAAAAEPMRRGVSVPAGIRPAVRV